MKKLKKNKQGVSNKNMISMIIIGKYKKDKDDLIKHTSKLSANCFGLKLLWNRHKTNNNNTTTASNDKCY